MNPERLRKIALYLKYIAFVIDKECKPKKTKHSRCKRKSNKNPNRRMT